jgi:serine/threonine protein kinase
VRCGLILSLKESQSLKLTGIPRQGNVLVSNAGDPCLTDFGLARILNDTRGMTTSSEVAGSLRWMSSELIRDEMPRESSDVWAYGMTVLVSCSDSK